MNALPHIYNLYEMVRAHPAEYRQLALNEVLMTEFSCPLEHRIQPIWSQHNYVLFVLEGKKVWHTADGSFDLTAGTCAFVRKGAAFVEQFFDERFCLVLFFLPDAFICDTLRPVVQAAPTAAGALPPIIRVDLDSALAAFFQSVLPYFSRMRPPDNALLELKFRELLLNIAGNTHNQQLLTHFCSLLQGPSDATLRATMEENLCYNLRLEEYAQLCNRSLSAFKRDFQKVFNTSPGKWLLAKRLAHARMLLAGTEKSVSEAAFESGFENLSHFSRVFRQQFGVSPASVRQQQVF